MALQIVQDWYTNELKKPINESIPTHDIKLDVRISFLKALHAKWLMKLYNYICSKLGII